MPALPDGTVTFLFTDIEGSTSMWESHPDQMRPALARHDALLREIIGSNNGVVFKTMGDAFCVVFATAADAVNAAYLAQVALHAEPWPQPLQIRVRMALHTGVAEMREDDYFGQPLNRVARLLAAGHGGQTLISMVTQELVRDALPATCSFISLGEHRLRDLARPETIFQLQHPDLPSDFLPLKSLDIPALPNNLPQPLTTFIGMKTSLAEIKTLMEKTRLLTLVGTGGCGKTRLSLQVAGDSMKNYPDGIWFVELGSISDAALVAQSVAQVLGVKEESGTPLTQTVAAFLKSRHILLLLDNCEHLLSACAQFASALMRICPQVHLLVTSREALNIAGERIFRVPSLSIPDKKQAIVLEELPRYEAVQLFIERAAMVKADFQVTAQNASVLIQLCHHLDGIPLAIELAAARIRSLPLEEINLRLNQRFRLLKGGDRAAPSRQQTLQAAIDWSYNTLEAQEQSLLCHLSVFVGGWTLAAAHAICADDDMEEWEVFDLLSSLVDKSLVVYEEQSLQGRYRLLETLREYCRERLIERREDSSLRERHCGYFLEHAEEAEAHLRGAEQAQWLARLEAEHDNLRAALKWTLDSTAQLRFVSALWMFWYIRGYISEGRAWAEGVLMRADPQPTLLRARVLHGAAVLAGYQGDQARAQSLLEQSLSLSRLMNDSKGIADTLNTMGAMAQRQGDYARARSLYEDSLNTCRTNQNLRGMTRSLTNLGIIACYESDYKAAHVYYDEAAALNRKLKDKLGLATLLQNLGWLAHLQQDFDQAQTLYAESLEIKREIGNTQGIAFTCLGLADIRRIQGHYEAMWPLLTECLTIFRELEDLQNVAYVLETCAAAMTAQTEMRPAARLFGFAHKLRQTISAPLRQEDIEEYDRHIALIRETLGEREYQDAWNAGQATTIEDVSAYIFQKITVE